MAMSEEDVDKIAERVAVFVLADVLLAILLALAGYSRAATVPTVIFCVALVVLPFLDSRGHHPDN